jgi:hypothetical protein
MPESSNVLSQRVTWFQLAKMRLTNYPIPVERDALDSLARTYLPLAPDRRS